MVVSVLFLIQTHAYCVRVSEFSGETVTASIAGLKARLHRVCSKGAKTAFSVCEPAA